MLLGRSTLDRKIEVTVSVGGGTASFGAAANDFTVTIPAGKLGGTGTLMLTPTDDEPVVGNEAVKISGTATDFVTIAGATVTITNDGPAFSVADAGVSEGDSGEADLDFALTLSSSSDMEWTVARATSDGTATVGSDYTADSGMLTFAAGDTSRKVTVKLTGDGDRDAAGRHQPHRAHRERVRLRRRCHRGYRLRNGTGFHA